MSDLVKKAMKGLGTDEKGKGDNHCLYYTGDGSDLRKWELKDGKVVISGNELGKADKKGTAKAETNIIYTFTGKKIRPGFKSYVVIDGTAYIYKKDFTVSTAKNLHSGNMTAVYKFKKNSGVYKSGIRKISQTAVISAKSMTADSVIIKMNKKQDRVTRVIDKDTMKKISKKDYTVDISNRVITFKGDYAGMVKF